MFNYHHTPIMSMGVMLFQVYMVFLLLWLAFIFKTLVAQLINRFLPKLAFINNIIEKLERFSSPVEIILIFLSVLLGAYTGFLLSALISYPMLNNPVLPALFLASGTSSGIAALMMATLLFTKESTHSPALNFVHKFELPVVLIEAFLLFAFCIGLFLGGGQKTVALYNAIGGGVWSYVFWVGLVGIGLIAPLFLNAIASETVKHRKGFILFVAGLSLFGVLCLRFWALYAGQMTLA